MISGRIIRAEYRSRWIIHFLFVFLGTFWEYTKTPGSIEASVCPIINPLCFVQWSMSGKLWWPRFFKCQPKQRCIIICARFFTDFKRFYNFRQFRTSFGFKWTSLNENWFFFNTYRSKNVNSTILRPQSNYIIRILQAFEWIHILSPLPHS